MEDFGQLMRRLLEIQSGGRQSNPELIAEDERLMEGLQKRNVVARPAQTVKLKPSFGAGAIRGWLLPGCPYTRDSQERPEQSLWAVHTDTPNFWARARNGMLRCARSCLS